MVLDIPAISEGEKLDTLYSDIRPHVRAKVLKSDLDNLEAAFHISLNVDSALFAAEMFSTLAIPYGIVHEPKDIGIVEGGTQYRGMLFKEYRNKQ